MRAQIFGRVLGTGLRVAGKMAGERLSAAVQAPTAPQTPSQAQPQTPPIANTAPRIPTPVQAARRTVQASGGVARGVGGFLRPFQRVGGILWLEVTGVFFLLPVIVFTPNLWRMRANWAHGPDHRMFVITAGVVLVFLYLGVSSFWRARRRSRS
jgi:hypothetical protein